MSYIHLTARERMTLFYLRQQGRSFREIGRHLGRHHSTLSREFKRNSRPYTSGYCDRMAQHYAVKRKQQRRLPKVNNYAPLRAFVQTHLKLGWSPEIIAGRLRRLYARQPAMQISHESIYQWLYREAAHGCTLYQQLPRSHKKRKKQFRYGTGRGLIPNRLDIRYRPSGANNRSRYGHWEGDTMVGKLRQGRIVTHVERKSRYLLAQRIKDGTANSFNQASIDLLQTIPERYRRTLTLDNGAENTQHGVLSNLLKMKIYFAQPYASWQRGTNEHTNGLIRRFFPKGTNFLSITAKEVDLVVELLNHRPRKCLKYQTPFEVFNHVTNGALET